MVSIYYSLIAAMKQREEKPRRFAMQTTSIINPNTGKSNKVRVWNIEPRQILAGFKSGEFKSAKDLSWKLLNEKESVKLMEKQLDGDASERNFGLSVFENALDWMLGLKVVTFIEAFLKEKKLPKPFQVAVNKKGDVFIITASGRIVA
jgi:hypothetical protein